MASRLHSAVYVDRTLASRGSIESSCRSFSCNEQEQLGSIASEVILIASIVVAQIHGGEYPSVFFNDLEAFEINASSVIAQLRSQLQ